MAVMISWVMPVNPSHPYLENDPAPSFAPTICAFHLGFSLVVGVHLTLQDGTYPEIDSGGIAYGFGFGNRLEVPYQHYADGWEQVRSAGSEGGVLLIPPEEAVKEILERRHASRNPNRKFLSLYLVFGVAGDDDPRMREDRDSPNVAIRISGLVKEQSID